MRATKEGMLIEIVVKPGSKRAKIEFDHHTEKLVVSVKSSPTKGKANRELLNMLREFLEKLGDISAHCAIVRGHTSRNKTILVRNINTEVFREKIQALFLS